MHSINDLAQTIKSMNKIYIITHMFPDGDALGSAFSLCRMLQKIGKQATVLLGNEIPKKFEFMKEYIEPQIFKEEYIISVDLASNSLLEPSLEKYASKIDLCIDHHISNRKFAALNYIDPTAAANSEIIYDLIELLNVPIDKYIAEGLYIGISSDTGCFRYSNTTYKSHEIAAKLMKQGVAVSRINEKLFTLKSKKILEIEKLLNQNIKYFADGQLAITFITLKDLQKYNIKDNECDGIASIPIRIEGVNVGITLREKSPDNYKVSVRTSEEVNANNVASMFEGGGHFRAAGFSIQGKINEIINEIANAVLTYLGWENK